MTKLKAKLLYSLSAPGESLLRDSHRKKKKKVKMVTEQHFKMKRDSFLLVEREKTLPGEWTGHSELALF